MQDPRRIALDYTVPGIPVERGDKLVVSAYAPAAGNNSFYFATGRLITTQGNLLQFSERYDGLPTTLQKPINLTDGWLQSFSVDKPMNGGNLGLLFVRVDLFRGEPQDDTARQMLTAGYVTEDAGVSWPFSRPIHCSEQWPRITTETITTPAAGAEAARSFQSLIALRINGFRARLTASAGVATRIVRLRVTQGAIIVGDYAHTISLAATQNFTYNWGTALPDEGIIGSGSTASLPIADFGPNCTVSTNTENLQVGDQWDQATISYRARVQVE